MLVFVGKGQIAAYTAKATSIVPEPLFLGEKPNVDDYYILADFVVNVSGGAGVSNSLLETLNHGVPVICWDRLTFTQVVSHGINGLICPQDDINALSKAFSEAFQGKRKFDPEQIRATVHYFSWDRISQAWIDLINGREPRGIEKPKTRNCRRTINT